MCKQNAHVFLFIYYGFLINAYKLMIAINTIPIMTEIRVSALNNMPMTTSISIIIVIILLTGANGILNGWSLICSLSKIHMTN